MKWQTVIGLEVHVQLKTPTKLFSSAAVDNAARPNSQVNIVDAALPGTLPILNMAAIPLAIKFGLACNCVIANSLSFDRKSYFYPDLPKGYQITQHRKPFLTEGKLPISINGQYKNIAINKAHLEEDAGKLIHAKANNLTLVDLNRAGTPLLEIVSAPVLESAKEAILYLKTLKQLICYLDISDCDMEKGAFRVDANVSIKAKNSSKLGNKVEIKNLNSFRSIEQAIEFEGKRQVDVLESGGAIQSETRLFDSLNICTRFMRHKEDEQNYLFMPDPDLQGIPLSPEMIAKARAKLPELPWDKRQRFSTQYQLSGTTLDILTKKINLANYYEQVVQICSCPILAANWIQGELLALLKKDKLTIDTIPVAANNLGKLLLMLKKGELSNYQAKNILHKMWLYPEDSGDFIHNHLDKSIETDELNTILDEVLAENTVIVQEYLSGRTKVIDYLVGMAINKVAGKLDPKLGKALLLKKLNLKVDGSKT